MAVNKEAAGIHQDPSCHGNSCSTPGGSDCSPDSLCRGRTVKSSVRFPFQRRQIFIWGIFPVVPPFLFDCRSLRKDSPFPETTRHTPCTSGQVCPKSHSADSEARSAGLGAAPPTSRFSDFCRRAKSTKRANVATLACLPKCAVSGSISV